MGQVCGKSNKNLVANNKRHTIISAKNSEKEEKWSQKETNEKQEQTTSPAVSECSFDMHPEPVVQGYIANPVIAGGKKERESDMESCSLYSDDDHGEGTNNIRRNASIDPPNFKESTK